MMRLQSIRLYAATLRHLKPRQFLALVRQRLVPSRKAPELPVNYSLRSDFLLGEFLVPVFPGNEGNSFEFLNVRRSFPDGMVDWVCSEMPKLWRYNLHYFDYLHDENRSLNERGALVTDWIGKNPPGTVDAWEPYTASLRIVNWIKWLSRHAEGLCAEPEWLASLYRQTAWLEKNIEYHLLANHYLKNGKALFFAGAYFSGARADSWLRRGIEILCSESVEQILADGGHYERSPMYHSIVLEDLLDVLNLATSMPGLIDNDGHELLVEKTKSAIDYLADITGPDGLIPLFNDSAYGISAVPASLFVYGKRVLDYEPATRGDGVSVSARADTGYYVIRDDADMLIVDCGEVGPAYQPGHAHCDALSFELWLNGIRTVVDTGTYDYENSDERNISRSTRGHNTLMLDEVEQSEIWGVFRVARRAHPLDARIEVRKDGAVVFAGSHDGYCRLRRGITHRREIAYQQGRWIVQDLLEGSGGCYVESFLHLAPGLLVTSQNCNKRMLVTDQKGVQVMEIIFEGELSVDVRQGRYFPQFGMSVGNQVVRFYGQVTMPFTASYNLKRINAQH